MGDQVTVRAPAKVNLHLGVGPAREDGFHTLATVYQAIGVYDDVTAAPSAEWSVVVRAEQHVDAEAVPLDQDNIVVRAGRMLAELHGHDERATLLIRKAIPVAGGMAGGSADAAATLVALDRLWDAGTSDDDLLALAARLGSDVPFALLGGTAAGSGRGEVVEPLPDHGTWWWVVVLSQVGLSTPAVYRHFDKLYGAAVTQPQLPADLIVALGSGEAAVLASALSNDLQPPALDLRPDLAKVLEDGRAAGALTGLLSGSGPSCLFLCRDSQDAHDVRHRLIDSGHPHVLAAPGPVAGAHMTEYA